MALDYGKLFQGIFHFWWEILENKIPEIWNRGCSKKQTNKHVE